MAFNVLEEAVPTLKNKWKKLCCATAQRRMKGHSGKTITECSFIGIGGSYLGQKWLQKL